MDGMMGQPLPPFTDICPKCGRKKVYEEKVLNKLSRRDNKTYICQDCGNDEAVVDFMCNTISKSGNRKKPKSKE